MHFYNKEHFFLSFVASIFLVALNIVDAKTVIIDPGHGGKDKGAHWYGISEKTLTLDVAKKVELLLKQIHFNAHTNSTVKGIETFYISSKGKKLAGSIQSRLTRRINTRDRGSKKYHYAVLRKTKGVAALVECGFISNRWESNRCSSSWYKEILAHEITEGIAAYCNNN